MKSTKLNCFINKIPVERFLQQDKAAIKLIRYLIKEQNILALRVWDDASSLDYSGPVEIEFLKEH